MKRLNRIFYIYSNASASVFLGIMALLEALCGAAIGGEIQIYFANPAAGFFAIVALGMWLSILSEERKYTQKYPALYA